MNSYITVLADEARLCTQCSLHASRNQSVFSRGTGASGLAFVGEGPGEEEDRLGQPFVGPAGQLLDKMIAAMQLARDDVRPHVGADQREHPLGRLGPTHLHLPLESEVRVPRVEGRKHFVEARLFDETTTYAEADALFIRVAPYPGAPTTDPALANATLETP